MQLELIKIESLPPDCETKVCIKCNKELPITAFNDHGGGNYKRTECKSCMKKLIKERDYLRSITPPPPKNYVCPVCLETEEQCAGKGGNHSTTWALDHDHNTGGFRGYLCHSCNRAIGCFRDDIERMQRAVEYLKK